jgi:glycosyltransferase involved in cell wall biosynthesis
MSASVAEPVPVTVVICARNRERVIVRCLDSIIAANPDEVIVVDGNSTDKTAEIARAAKVMVVSDQGAGLGAARQLGAQLAANEYVAFVDTDVVICPDTLRVLVDEAREQGYDAVQAELRTLSASPSYWQAAEAWRRKDRQRKGLASVLGCQTTLVRKELLMKVGFDPAFKGSAEDADFCFRARAAGARIAHSERAVAYHEDRGSLLQFVDQRIWHGRGLARMIVRYRSRYVDKAVHQAASARSAVKLEARYVPYICISWGCAAVGVILELLHLIYEPTLRHRLSDITLSPDQT